LRPLLTAAKRTGVALAVENHPHIVRHADDLKLLAEFVDELSGVGLRSCPDTGAFNPEIAHEGFATLARHAAHVHVKAPVQEQGKDALVDAYRPFVRALQSTKYKGHLSIEFLEVDDPNADSLEGTWRAARAIGKLIGEEIAPRPPRLDVLQPSRRIMGSPLRIAETSVAIIEDALPLMLEGCEHRLKDSPVRLRTFSKAGERDFGSPNCRTTNACSATECHIPLRECFCALVACESTGVQQCSRFYAEQFQRIKESSDPGPDVCLCPLGLAVLFVPIRTERDLYGAVVCGGWRESGTEGVIIYGIDRWLDCDAVKERVEEAILAIPYLTSGALRNAYQPELFTQSFSLRRAKREGTKGTEEDVRV
jgi:hypothetical protein